MGLWREAGLFGDPCTPAKTHIARKAGAEAERGQVSESISTQDCCSVSESSALFSAFLLCVVLEVQ